MHHITNNPFSNSPNKRITQQTRKPANASTPTSQSIHPQTPQKQKRLPKNSNPHPKPHTTIPPIPNHSKTKNGIQIPEIVSLNGRAESCSGSPVLRAPGSDLGDNGVLGRNPRGYSYTVGQEGYTLKVFRARVVHVGLQVL